MQSKETKKLEASGAMFSRIVLQTLQPLTILDWRDDSGITDTLFLQSDRSKGCTRNRCTGSKVGAVSLQLRDLYFIVITIYRLDHIILQSYEFLNKMIFISMYN